MMSTIRSPLGGVLALGEPAAIRRRVVALIPDSGQDCTREIRSTHVGDEIVLAWCKARALDYLDRGDAIGAIASFSSDMRKHPDTDTPAVSMLCVARGVPLASAGDTTGLRAFIEGFA